MGCLLGINKRFWTSCARCEERGGASGMSAKSDRLSDKQMKDYRITVRFPAALRRRLKQAARSQGTRESDLVRGAVERQLSAKDHVITAYERAQKGWVNRSRAESKQRPQHESKTFRWIWWLLISQVLVDTGPIVAILSASDEHHGRCVEQLRSIRGPLLTCWPVLTEAAWLLRSYPRALGTLMSSFQGRPFELLPLYEADLSGIAVILAKYKGLGIQLADASLVHLANREGIETMFTLDRRDFGVLRRARGKKFRIIP